MGGMGVCEGMGGGTGCWVEGMGGAGCGTELLGGAIEVLGWGEGGGIGGRGGDGGAGSGCWGRHQGAGGGRGVQDQGARVRWGAEMPRVLERAGGVRIGVPGGPPGVLGWGWGCRMEVLGGVSRCGRGVAGRREEGRGVRAGGVGDTEGCGGARGGPSSP